MISRSAWGFFIAALVVTATSLAAELRPFNLPSQNANAPPPLTVQQRTVSGISNTYYDNFARDVEHMDAQRVEVLRTDFQKRLAQAKANNRADEQAHYERMLGILDAFGRKSR